MRRRSVLLLCLLAFASPRAVLGDEARATAFENFLRDRDTERVYLALEALGEPPAGPVMALLDLARGRVPTAPPEGADPGGFAALPEVVAALHALDLDGAARAVARADAGDGGMAAAWAGALIRVRRGDDTGGVGRLLAPPLFEWGRDAFPLALLGAALPPEDRIMLAAAGRAALLRAAARGRVAAMSGTALALAALDVEAGREAIVLAVRALRRHGNDDETRRLLAVAPAAGVPRNWPALAFEEALTTWRAGGPGDVASALSGVAAPTGAQASFFALRRAGRRARALDTGARLRHATGDNARRALIARLATALGVPTRDDDIERWTERLGSGAPTMAALARRFLEHRGLAVLEVAGSAEAGEAALAAGRPFLLMRLARTDSGYRDIVSLVRGSDRRTGLWLLDEPDVGRIDVLPRAAAAKSHLLLAVPAEERALTARFAGTPAAQLGRVLADALDEGERGDLASAAERLSRAGSPLPAVAGLYRAYLLHRQGKAEGRDELLAPAREALDGSRRIPPLLGFEAYVRGLALLAAGERVAGLAAYDRVERLEGPSGLLAMARFFALRVQNDRAGARAAIEAARRLEPLDGRVLFYRGATRVEIGAYDEARGDFRRALGRSRDVLRVAVALASLEIDVGRPAAALEVLRETVRQDPALEADPRLRYRRRLAERALIEAAESVEALQHARRSPEPDTRRRLAFALAVREAEGDEAEALLRTLLADDDVGVRTSTLRLYARPWLRRRVESDPVLGRQVCLMLEQDDAGNVRAAAAALLGRLAAPFGTRALAACLAGESADADPAVRAAAARALAAHDSPAARAVLVTALEDPEGAVRRAAIDALFQIAATTHDFEPEGEAAEQAAALARWRAWLAEDR